MAGTAFCLARSHPLLLVLACFVLFLTNVEYTHLMVLPGDEPYDLGFAFTKPIYGFLLRHAFWNSTFAAANTVFVFSQMAYVLSAWIIGGRMRPLSAALFMFTSRGILGYLTQLPLPQEFIGSGLDFPVANTSFFLFFSGHVAGSVIVSQDLRRLDHSFWAQMFDCLNILQSVRLLATRGHYTIDLVVGAGAGWVFDLLAGKYEKHRLRNKEYMVLLNDTEGIN